MSLQAIFWDNDGVLMATEELYYQANRDVLAQLGIDLAYPQHVQVSLREGRSVLDLALLKGYSNTYIKQLREIRNDYYVELLKKKAAPYPEVSATLLQIPEKITLGIVTSSPREHFNVMHKTHNLTKFFQWVLAREDFTDSKPHPAAYLKALKKCPLAASQCLVIEDSPRGLQSAQAAGLKCAVVRRPHLNEEDFSLADYIFDDVSQVLDLL
jgi:HAD superfamily hydrolase (TIGR01509 family)